MIGAGLVAPEESVVQERSPSLQDAILKHVRDERAPVTVFPVNRVMLQGDISYCDRYSVSTTREAHIQLVHKHAISAVSRLNLIHLKSAVDEAAT